MRPGQLAKHIFFYRYASGQRAYVCPLVEQVPFQLKMKIKSKATELIETHMRLYQFTFDELKNKEEKMIYSSSHSYPPMPSAHRT